MIHLRSEVALDVIEGRIGTNEMKALTEHMERCSSCSQQLAEWRRVHELLQATHLERAPVEFVERAESIFDAWPDRRPSIGEIMAAIVFDSHAQPAFAGARGATDARQIVMRAEELDIHLKISSNPFQQQIIGQVFARNESQYLSGVCLHLLQNGKPYKTTWSDNFGQFQFDEVPQAVFHLQIDLPKLTVVGGVSIGQRAP